MAREFRTSPDFKTAVLANGSAGTNGQVLTSAGAGSPPSWTTVSGGGGGLTKFTEAESTSSPNATVYVDSLTAAATSTNADVALVAKGTGATLAQVPDGTTAGGNKRGTYATDLQKSRSASNQVASGIYSVIAGGYANRANDQYAFVGGGYGNSALASTGTVCGGDGNSVSNTSATIAGGATNSASSSYSFIGGGQLNTAQTNSHATVCGGNGNVASGQYSFLGGGQYCNATGSLSVVAGGQNCSASGTRSAVGGGEQNSANGTHSCIPGGAYGTTRSIQGYAVFPACNAPLGATQGFTQSGLLLLARQTTDATATVLTSNSSAASTTNQVILPNNAAYSFSGEVIAGVTGGGNTARWTISGAIKRGAGAGTTAMVGIPTVIMTHNDAGAAAWVVNVTADTTNGGIAVTVTGAASTTIRWVAKLTTTEMTF